jgi:glutamate racemase
MSSQPALSERSESKAARVESKGPIGVFDSGVGGLSVLREIRRELPAEDLLYVADTANAPYGDRDAAFIRERALAIVARLMREQVKAVVVACNTATGLAVDALRERYDLPIVAIEPAVKPAALKTRSGVIAVLATTQTLASERFSKLVSTHASGVIVLTQPSPGLVERVEAGDLSSPETRTLVAKYVGPLVARGADSIVLGCTHYPFLRGVIEDVAGPSVTIIDPAIAVAREVRRRLEAAGLLAPETHPGTERVWTTGPPEKTREVVAALWGTALDVTLVN